MNTRLSKIDEIRGLTLISMILYHFLWDLRFIAGFNIEWYTGPVGYVWQKSICVCFIFISGFCFSMGKNRLKRSSIVFLCGIVISAVTLFFMPENRVVFGILTFIGTAGIITIPLDKLHRKLEKKLGEAKLNLTLVIGTLLLFIVFFNLNNGYLFCMKRIELPGYLFSGYVETFFGFTDPNFFSTDYFAIFPWIFNYLLGYYTYRFLMSVMKERVESALSKDRFTWASCIGRHTLLIYMLHQPVLYLITLILQRIF